MANYFDVLVNGVFRRLEDPVGLARPLLGDFSYWQRKVNADVAKANGFLGGIFRATRGRYYKDPYFKVNYDDFGEAELYRGSYHVIYPDQPVIAQIDNYYEVHPEIDIFPRTLDLEITRDQPPSKIADVTWHSVELCRARDGQDPILYTRYALADLWLSGAHAGRWADEMMNNVWWWLAQYLFAGYLEHPGPPTLPKRVARNRVIMHQTSDHKLAPPGMVASKAVDWDRWELGNEEEMHQWIKDTWGEETTPPDPPEPIQPVEPLERVKVIANALNVRSLPDANSTDLGELIKDSVVPVVQTKGVWKKISGWIHGDWTTPI